MTLSRSLTLFFAFLALLAWQMSHTATQAVTHAQHSQWQAAERASEGF